MLSGMFYRVVLLVSILTCSAAQAQGFDKEQAFKKGEAEWNRGDPVSAMPLLKSAADAGHAAAQALFGYLLDQADNDAEAADYYQRSAAQGNGDGAFGLAGFYLSGDGGLGKDPAMALKLLRTAADSGHAQSIITLSQAYSSGGMGLSEQDKTSVEALKWLRTASDLNHLPSMIGLEAALRNGTHGLVADIPAADVLLAKIYKIQGIDPNAVQKKRRRRQ